MPRICTTLVLVSSLLVAAGPAQAKSTVSHRQEARAGAAKSHVSTTKQIKRHGTAKLVHKYTYGRT